MLAAVPFLCEVFGCLSDQWFTVWISAARAVILYAAIEVLSIEVVESG
jgi:hypothetical protein